MRAELRERAGVEQVEGMTDEQVKELEDRKRELKRLREKVQERYDPEQHYEAIPEERKKELKAAVLAKKRMYLAVDMQKRNLEDIEDKFNAEFSDFMQKFG